MELTRELLEQFEYTLPLIKSNVSEIRLDSSRDIRGQIELRNAGGGTLEGNVSCSFPAFSFWPAQFTGNKVTVEYKVQLGVYKPGDVVDTSVIILSNGGELVIPVHISVTSRSLTTDDGAVLLTMEDFLAYAESNIAEAVRVFGRKNFAEWLADMPSGVNMELYEHLKFDTNKERAVDNFLICHGLKQKSAISLEEASTDIAVCPGQRDAVNGVIYLTRPVPGFTQASVHVRGHAPWLRLITNKITTASFDKTGVSCVDYIINPLLLESKRAMADVIIRSPEETLTHRLFVKTLPVLNVCLNKNAYTLTDNGKVVIENNTGADLVVEIMPKHDFIHFEGKRYLIGARADIPFEMKMTAQRLGQLSGGKTVYERSEIMVKTVHSGTVFTRVLEVGISVNKGAF